MTWHSWLLKKIYLCCLNYIFLYISEVLSSDEDEIDDEGQDYLESLTKKAVNAVNNASLPITATINDIEDDSDDDDSDYKVSDETVLESYTTPLDEENCELDEFILFKDVMSSEYKYSSI